jgi:hypothetical protein
MVWNGPFHRARPSCPMPQQSSDSSGWQPAGWAEPAKPAALLLGLEPVMETPPRGSPRRTARGTGDGSVGRNLDQPGSADRWPAALAHISRRSRYTSFRSALSMRSSPYALLAVACHCSFRSYRVSPCFAFSRRLAWPYSVNHVTLNVRLVMITATRFVPASWQAQRRPHCILLILEEPKGSPSEHPVIQQQVLLRQRPSAHPLD